MKESLPGGYGPKRGSSFISVVRAAVTSVKIVGSGVVGGTGLENNLFILQFSMKTGNTFSDVE